MNVALYLEHYPSVAQNTRVAERLREHYAPHVDTYGLRVDQWLGSQGTAKRQRIITQLDTGYETGDPQQVARRAADVLSAWARLFAEHSIKGIDNAVARDPDE